MQTKSKWVDTEDLEDLGSDETENPNIHKKIKKKHNNLAKGLKEYKDSFIENKGKFLSWMSKKKDLKKSKTGALLAKADVFDVSVRKEFKMKKAFRTDKHDSINSVVQAVNYCSQTQYYLYAGFDKKIKFVLPSDSDSKGYKALRSVYLEGLPIVNAKFANSTSVMLSYLRKKFISIYDIEKQKPVHFYKLFKTDNHDIKVNVNKANLSLISNNKEINLFDHDKKVSIAKKTQSNAIVDTCFINQHDFAIAYDTENIKIFDIRASLAKPKNMLDLKASLIESNGKCMVTGNNNGIVNLIDLEDSNKVVRRFDNLTTEISSLSINRDFMAFSSKWKNNSVRLVDLRDNNVLKDWPNIKTRLGVVNRILLNQDDQLACGTANGSLDVYGII